MITIYCMYRTVYRYKQKQINIFMMTIKYLQQAPHNRYMPISCTKNNSCIMRSHGSELSKSFHDLEKNKRCTRSKSKNMAYVESKRWFRRIFNETMIYVALCTRQLYMIEKKNVSLCIFSINENF